MDDAVADLFNDDVMLNPVWCTWRIVERQVDDMVEGMVSNAGGPLG
jgi:hypothetical protein